MECLCVKFYDQDVGNVRSVESMGDKFKSETLAPALVPLIVDKLPKRVVEKWELEIGDHKENFMAVKTLFTFLEQLIRAKESSQPLSLESKLPTKENTAKGVSHVNFKPSSQRRSSTSALCASTQVKECRVCRKNHHVRSCVNFLSLTVKDRFRMALSKGLCFRCLEAGHVAQSCEKLPCKHCRGRHHSLLLLHVDSVSSGSSAIPSSSQPPLEIAFLSQALPSTAASYVVASSMAASGGGNVILQTVPAIICGSNGCSKVVRCFLDPGSQTSFVRQSIVEELGLKSEEDRDSHRYLWRDLDTNSTPKIYRMTRVTFGVICSPFLAICTTQKHARRCKETFPEASEEILRNTYVDDFASGKDEVHEALRLQRSSTELMEQAAFNLTKWSSNSPELMQAVPEKDRASESLINLESDLPGVYSITKALGLKWETISDSFIFMNDMNSLKSSSETLYTKREVASLAAKVFDPIGLIAPFTVRSKLLLQRLWTQGVGWDDVIPVETSVKWIQATQATPA